MCSKTAMFGFYDGFEVTPFRFMVRRAPHEAGGLVGGSLTRSGVDFSPLFITMTSGKGAEKTSLGVTKSPIPEIGRPRETPDWCTSAHFAARRSVKTAQLRGGSRTLAKQNAAAEKTETAAVAASAAAPKPSTKSAKVAKLAPKNKTRLPRREKKAQKKAAGRL